MDDWMCSHVRAYAYVCLSLGFILNLQIYLFFCAGYLWLQQELQTLLMNTCFLSQAHVSCLVWLGASQYIATGCADGKILIIDSLSGCLVKTFSNHSKTILSLSISSNGKFLVSGSEDKQVLVFDIAEFS
ncbi:hypothetical protein IFM89_011599 [Coptis chinensis]|uniref:Uncharacterized protein n=1 Tax=Coptis chinensis TaxID=261450 RepID=A0A835LLT4_9MAGN|nr:hypothetical protein IFM89_011599 [Coptis chinensis]